jgi:hypothetical protein
MLIDFREHISLPPVLAIYARNWGIFEDFQLVDAIDVCRKGKLAQLISLFPNYFPLIAKSATRSKTAQVAGECRHPLFGISIIVFIM